MASEGGYEGKDIATQMKKVEDIKAQIQEWINNDKKGQAVLKNGNFPVIMDIQKSDKDYKFICFGVEVMSMDGNQDIIYNKEGLSKLKRLMEETGIAKYEDLGLPAPEYIAEMENMRDGENKTGEKTEEDLSEKIGTEKDEEDGKQEEMIKDIAREEDVSVEEVKLELSDIRTIDGIETIKQKIPEASKYTSIVAIPKKGMVTGYKYKGMTDEGQLEDLELNEQRYGTNPNVEVIILGKDKIDTIMLSDIHEIEDGEGRIGTYIRSIWNTRSCLF